MSAREWKPGDVALVEVGCHANRVVAIRTGVPSNMGWAYSGTHHGKSSNNWSNDTSGVVTPVRPLVVIDPEDAEEVERLRLTIGGDRGCLAINLTHEMQAALREFANPTPPKPEVYEHIVINEVGSIVTAACGKAWRPDPDVTVVGRCPECQTISEGWRA